MGLDARRLGPIGDLAAGESWEPDRLGREIDRRVPVLRRLGARPGARVVLAHGDRPAFFADLLAAWRLGACAVCVNPGVPESELANICEFTEPAAVLTSVGSGCGAGLNRPVVALEDESAGGGAACGADGSLDDPALMLFTSGTTGDPKGVVHSFRSILTRIALNRVHIGDATLARTLCVLPTRFGHGLIGNCLTPLLAGHSLFLGGGMGIEVARSLSTTIAEHDITFLSSVPSFWKMVLRLSGPPEPGVLRQVSVGSAPLSAELWNDIAEWAGTRNVVNMYGLTETASWFSGASAACHEPESGLIGAPWGGVFGVLDAGGEGQEVRNTGEGELVVQTPSLMSGYFRRDDLTARAIAGGWYRSGDVGYLDGRGVARLTGRVKHEINRAGIKIHPEEIDVLLERHESVQEACAFGIPDDISGEVVGVAVQVRAGADLSLEALRAWCRERMRVEATPVRWFRLNEIPKSGRGKVNRDAVRRACLEPLS